VTSGTPRTAPVPNQRRVDMTGMEDKIRVMVVDDSASFRRLLQDILHTESDIEVVGTAGSGHAALMKFERLQPESMILDIRMPGMGGIKTLKAVKQRWPKTGVIICSHLSEASADVALEALASGAIDFVTKAPQLAPDESLIARLRSEIVPRLRAYHRSVTAKLPVCQSPALSDESRSISLTTPRDVVAIGVSTGGPAALRTVLCGIPSEIKATILVVQHMPPIFTKRLADQLAAVCDLPVKEAEDREEARYGTVYLAPGDYHLEVRRRGTVPVLALTRGSPENSVRPAADVLFRSVAAGFGPRAIGVVLTGMGSDGFLGAQHIKAGGGLVVVQDQATSVIWGMPRYVAEAGLADRICPLPEIPRLITRLTDRGREDSKGD